MALRYAQGVVDISTTNEQFKGHRVADGIGKVIQKFIEAHGVDYSGTTLDVRLNLDDESRSKVIILVTDRDDE